MNNPFNPFFTSTATWEKKAILQIADICEEPGEQSSFATGPVICTDCEEKLGEACELYKSCPSWETDQGREVLVSEGYAQPCLDRCMINGEPVPTEEFDVPDHAEDSPLGRSVNAGETIKNVPSWSVNGGHSGPVLIVNRGKSEDKYEIERTTRLPGTRAVVHTHDWGGVTCLQQGEMTLLLDGLAEPVTRHAGECYWMPAKRFMTGVNTGNEVALMWDIFGLPADDKVDMEVLGLTPKENFEESKEVMKATMELCEKTKQPYNLVGEGSPCGCANDQNKETAGVTGASPSPFAPEGLTC